MQPYIVSHLEKILLALLVSTLLIACEDTKTSSNDSLSPLVGSWKRQFERNASMGTQTIEVSSDGFFTESEIGDNNIMNEWNSGLPAGVTYSFIVTPGSPYTAKDSIIYIEASSGTAQIKNLDTGNIVATWDISSIATQMDYSIENNGQALTISSGSTVRKYTKIR